MAEYTVEVNIPRYTPLKTAIKTAAAAVKKRVTELNKGRRPEDVTAKLVRRPEDVTAKLVRSIRDNGHLRLIYRVTVAPKRRQSQEKEACTT